MGSDGRGHVQAPPGIPVTASLPLTTAQLTAALGRTPTAPTTTVALLPTASSQGNLGAALFDERLTQVDLRLTRVFRIGRTRLQASGELYNVTNTRPAQAINTTYSAATTGTRFMTPTSILGGRLFKFGAIDF